MGALGNTPRRVSVLPLEQRKSYAFGMNFALEDDTPVNLTGCTVSLVVAQPPHKGGAVVITKAATFIDASLGTVLFSLQAADMNLDVAEYPFSITLTSSLGYKTLVMKGVFDIQENVDPVTTGTYAAVNPSTTLTAYYDGGDIVEVKVAALDGMYLVMETRIAEMNAIKASVDAATAAANTTAAASQTSANQSAASAAAALTSKNDAATSATNSATSATNSAASATTATTKASEAATSATGAAGSASTASTQAATATTKATEAATSATNAATSATTATTKATEASASAANATTGANTATTKAAEASTSASSASTSATSATTSKNQAATSATNAADSATNAATSATNAATSKNDAAASATTATTKATEAATSATNAATSAASVPGMWQANTSVTAGSVKVAPDGSTISRIANGTTRATFDATEQAAWEVVVAKAGTLDRVALDGLFKNVGELVAEGELPARLADAAVAKSRVLLTNLNVNPGFVGFFVTGETTANQPSGCIYGTGWVSDRAPFASGASMWIQEVTNGRTWTRHYVGTTWGAWQEIGHAGLDARYATLGTTQTIAGIKTFSSSPVVPDASWTIGKTTGLQGALDAKAPLAAPALTGAATLDGQALVKTNDTRLADARTPTAHAHLIVDLPTDATAPSALGTAAAGTSSSVARRDHVHAMPTAAQVGASDDTYVLMGVY